MVFLPDRGLFPENVQPRKSYTIDQNLIKNEMYFRNGRTDEGKNVT